MKNIYKDKEATVHWSAARNEERVFVPPVHREFCSPTGLNGTSLVSASGGVSRTAVVESPRGKRVRCVLGGESRLRSDPLPPAPPCPSAVRRPAPTLPWYVRVPDMPCMIKFAKTNKRRYHFSAARNEERSRSRL